jgi:hypothetical protein
MEKKPLQEQVVTMKKNKIIFIQIPTCDLFPEKKELSLMLNEKEENILFFENFSMFQKQKIPKNEIFAYITNSISEPLILQEDIPIIFMGSLNLVNCVENLKKKHNLNHIINSKSLFFKKELEITIKKIKNKDIFGISKYLKSEFFIKNESMKKSSDRDIVRKQIKDFCSTNHFSINFKKHVEAISEEMMMNAFFDATTASQKEAYQKQSRSYLELEPEDFIELSYGFDGDRMVIGIKDSFGLFLRETFFTYLKKVLVRHDWDQLVDQKRGGAGLGLFKIIYNSHGIVCNLSQGKCTEVISWINKNEPFVDFNKSPRSIHFFV